MQTYIASYFAFRIKVPWKKNGTCRTCHELQIISKDQMQSGEKMRGHHEAQEGYGDLLKGLLI